MLHLLAAEQYDCVRPLFGQETPPLYCQGILAGKYPGKVIVDRPDNPGTALLIKDVWCHLIGNASNAPFNAALRLALARKDFIGEQTGALFFVDPSEAWCAVLNELVENRRPIETPRYLYIAAQACPIPALPEGFALRFIDESLREAIEGELPGDVQKVLELRQDTAVPDEMAFGYVALSGRTCAAWSVIDFIVGDTGEIRLVTAAPNRRRGLAHATSAAAITYGLTHGLRQINWDAAASNVASLRTAEKLGLQLLNQPTEYILIFPEAGYLINLAWSHLDFNRFEQTLAVTQQMTTSDKKMLVQYGHFLAGAAWAGLANRPQAIHHLNTAIAAGFDDWGEMEDCPALAGLRGSAEWEQMRARIAPIK